MLRRLLIVLPLLTVLVACTTHVDTRYPTWAAYKAAYPNARYVVVYEKPSPNRSCWKVRRGWRCVAR